MQAAIVGTLYRGDRQADRFGVNRRSTLRAGPGHAVDAIIQDLSACGCRIHGQFSLRPGETIQVGLAGVGARTATVVWSDGDVAGCEFAQWLSYEEIKQTSTAQTLIDVDFRGTENAISTSDVAVQPRLKFRARLGLILAGGLFGWLTLIALAIATFSLI